MCSQNAAIQQCLHALETLCQVPAPGRQCPRCKSLDIGPWGQYSGRRRFRCRDCRKTFSDLTGTPASYSKLIELWPDYIECMRGALPLRQCAAKLGISLSTAFRWRHAILMASRLADATRLSGRIELHELRMAYSQKGSRRLDRPPRVRGARTHDPLLLRTPRVCVVLAHAPPDHNFSQHVDARNLGSSDLRAVLLPRIRVPAKILAARGPFSPYAILAKAAGAGFHWATPHPHKQLAGVLAFLKRIREFLLPFRGVATKYLDNYLRWHRVLEVSYA